MNGYLRVYPPSSRQIVAYNSASLDFVPYRSHSSPVISYFGNLGVGRVDSLVQIADVLYDIDHSLFYRSLWECHR